MKFLDAGTGTVKVKILDAGTETHVQRLTKAVVNVTG